LEKGKAVHPLQYSFLENTIDREDWQGIWSIGSQRVGDWNARVGSQETPGVTGKFGP